jgi:hypothetical protein
MEINKYKLIIVPNYFMGSTIKRIKFETNILSKCRHTSVSLWFTYHTFIWPKAFQLLLVAHLLGQSVAIIDLKWYSDFYGLSCKILKNTKI